MRPFKRRREARLDYLEQSFRRKLFWKYPWLGKDWWVSRNRDCMKGDQ